MVKYLSRMHETKALSAGIAQIGVCQPIFQLTQYFVGCNAFEVELVYMANKCLQGIELEGFLTYSQGVSRT